MATSIVLGLRIKNLTGKRFDRLEVIRCAGKNKHGRSLWECICDCGVKKTIAGNALQKGNTRSCGCLQNEVNHSRFLRHGMKGTAEYRAWRNMKTRCLNLNATNYSYYGERGIIICDRWRGEDGFANFHSDMGPKPSSRHSLDRKDNAGPYSPDNCQWATMKTQCANRRKRRWWKKPCEESQ